MENLEKLGWKIHSENKQWIKFVKPHRIKNAYTMLMVNLKLGKYSVVIQTNSDCEVNGYLTFEEHKLFNDYFESRGWINVTEE
jgi:hypothetical protein